MTTSLNLSMDAFIATLVAAFVAGLVVGNLDRCVRRLRRASGAQHGAQPRLKEAIRASNKDSSGAETSATDEEMGKEAMPDIAHFLDSTSEPSLDMHSDMHVSRVWTHHLRKEVCLHITPTSTPPPRAHACVAKAALFFSFTCGCAALHAHRMNYCAAESKSRRYATRDSMIRRSKTRLQEFLVGRCVAA